MKKSIVFLSLCFFWGCTPSKLYQRFIMRDTSNLYKKDGNVAIRIYYGKDSEPFSYFNKDDNQGLFSYTCDEESCEIHGFIAEECSDSCLIEWLIDDVVVKRVSLVDHETNSVRMSFSLIEDGEKHLISPNSWYIVELLP